VTEYRTSEALEKLNRGIEESKQVVQQQTMTLAKDFFGDSVQELKQQIKENRATLERLPDQIPGGQEEPFQMLFREKSTPPTPHAARRGSKALTSRRSKVRVRTAGSPSTM
jgi:hypothetical protein